MPTIPYASGVPIGPQPRPDDGLGSTSSGRARAEAMRRLSLDEPGMDHATTMAALPARMAEESAAATGPTVLQPSRTTAFGSRDAQALAGLDPRALEEAKGLAALDQPKAMTGTFGGKSFEMTPAARVGRNELAQIYNKYQGKQAQEREDAVRGQIQSGRERLVSIPGEQGITKRGMELGAEERMGAAERDFKAPTRDADIAAKGAQTAAATGAEGRAQAEFGERIRPEQQAVDEALAAAQASPFAQTPAGRARIAALMKLGTVGKQLPADAQAAVAGSGAPDSASTAIAEVAADPALAALVERAKKTEPGAFTGGQGRATGAAARRVAASAITARLRQAGVPDAEIQDYITSTLGAQAEPGAGVFGRVATAPLRMIPGGGLLADAISGR